MDRFKWPTPSAGYFRRRLEEGDSVTIAYRVERYTFLWEEFGPPADMLLFGGIPSLFALDELKRSFAHGNFMATVLLAQAFIEQSLGATYSIAGRDDIAEKRFAGLVAVARDDGQISLELAETLDRLRRTRNPYTHHITGLSRSYMGRLNDAEFVAPEDLVVEDAKFAVRAVVDYLRSNSPNWNPTNHQWSEDSEIG